MVPSRRPHVDPQLINPWGISFDPNGEFWISDNNSGVSTLYDGNGVKDPLVVTIPGVGGTPGTPTGQVANSTGGFNVTENGTSFPATFIFASEDGTISGWNPSVDPTKAIIAVDNSSTAVYKGLTMATVSNAPETIGGQFPLPEPSMHLTPISAPSSNRPVHFADTHIPKHYAPFNVQNIDGNIFVTYAKQNAAKHDDVGGAGHGFVDEFTAAGTLMRRFQHGSFENSPWGLAIAPSTFDKYAGDLLVGNFQSGFVDVYNPANWKIPRLSQEFKAKETPSRSSLGPDDRFRRPNRKRQFPLFHRRHPQ